MKAKFFRDFSLIRYFYIRTYGCQSNVRDSETIAGYLTKMDYLQTTNIEEADLIILNTCAIRHKAEQKVFSEIGALKKLKDIKPHLIFAICGCMTQEIYLQAKIRETFPYVDLIFGTHNIHEFPKLMQNLQYDNMQIYAVWDKPGPIQEKQPVLRNSKIIGYVNIMIGCNNFCTYCVVPKTRGPQQSRTLDAILEEVHQLIDANYQEIYLLGQNVNSWGIDLYGKNSFAMLLEAVAKTSIKRIRFMTSNPWDFFEDILQVMQKYANIMRYIHLPVQSGDSEILYMMNRNHTREQYIALIEKIRHYLPNCAISTDIIVGFPNESEEQFENTLSLYKICDFTNAFTFIYSPRPNTHAATLVDNIALKTKQVRLARLNDLVKRHAKIHYQKHFNSIMDVLVLSYSRNNKSRLTGYTPCNKVVNFTGNISAIGKIIPVKITNSHNFSLLGESINQN